MKAGALGEKTNDSHAAGCMFAYAPNNPEEVGEAIEKIGGRVYIIQFDEGTRIE